LADVAQKTNTTIILVTHLSAGGEALGRRIVGQCRQMISLAKIEGEPHNSRQRKVWVSKSNSVMPNELLVTMGDNGNEYKGEGEQPVIIGPSKINENEWLAIYLKSGKKPLELLLSDAAMHGLNVEIIKKLIPLIANQLDVGSYNWIKLVKRE
jgi:hypothetical protein